MLESISRRCLIHVQNVLLFIPLSSIRYIASLSCRFLGHFLYPFSDDRVYGLCNPFLHLLHTPTRSYLIHFFIFISFPFYQRTGWVFVSNSLIYIISFHIELSPWDFCLVRSCLMDGCIQREEVNDRLENKIDRGVSPGSLCMYLFI